MPSSNEFVELVMEQMSSIDRVRAKRMFGGVGIYQGDLFFGIIDDDQLYFKADEKTVGEFTSRGLTLFSITMRDKTMTMQYYQAPAEVFDRVEAMVEWANKGIAAAKRAAIAKSKTKSKSPAKADRKKQNSRAQKAKKPK
jgi:DNA transformation protein and related proteins